MKNKIKCKLFFITTVLVLLSACDSNVKTVSFLKDNPAEAEAILKKCGNPSSENIDNCNNARDALAKLNVEKSLERLKN